MQFAWSKVGVQQPTLHEAIAHSAEALSAQAIMAVLAADGSVIIESITHPMMISAPLLAALKEWLRTGKAGTILLSDRTSLVGCILPGHAAMVAFVVPGTDPDADKYVAYFAMYLARIINYDAERSFASTTDPLTGLLTRDAFVSQAQALLATSQRGAAIVLDLDGFKLVNDLLGTIFGDHVLAESARRLQHIAGASAILARGGADEFFVYLDDVNTRSEIAQFVGRIAAELRRPFDYQDSMTSITVSAGSALAPEDGTTISEVISHADLALHEVRRGERGAHLFYNPAIRKRNSDMQELISGIVEAIDRHELRVFFQPTVDLETGSVVGAEALIRWIHPTRGLLNPKDFLDAAATAGVLADVGRFVLRTVCELLSSPGWKHPGMTISVNVAAAQLYDPSLIAHAIATTRAYGISPRQIVLEILEDTLVADPHEIELKLQQLRDHGFRIALDDFGTGLSSLSYLTTLPIDVVKIDRSFVMRVGSKREDAVLEAIRLLSDRRGR